MAEARAGEMRIAHIGGIDVLLTPAAAVGTIMQWMSQRGQRAGA